MGLDPSLYNPMPMGISFYAKDFQLDEAAINGWNVWEKRNKSGSKRDEPRSPTALETIVAFSSANFLNFVRLQRRASWLRLDQSLRYSLARDGPTENPEPFRQHALEKQFELTSAEILEIISGRSRLAVAVRGGVAEHHLERRLRADMAVDRVTRLDVDSMHDFDVRMRTGYFVRIECKNASPQRYSDGTMRVEVQKTRASKGDPASRFYRVDAFDVVAACVFSATQHWDFVSAPTNALDRHKDFPDRIAPIQRLDRRWSNKLDEALTPSLSHYRGSSAATTQSLTSSETSARSRALRRLTFSL